MSFSQGSYKISAVSYSAVQEIGGQSKARPQELKKILNLYASISYVTYVRLSVTPRPLPLNEFKPGMNISFHRNHIKARGLLYGRVVSYSAKRK